MELACFGRVGRHVFFTFQSLFGGRSCRKSLSLPFLDS